MKFRGDISGTASLGRGEVFERPYENPGVLVGPLSIAEVLMQIVDRVNGARHAAIHLAAFLYPESCSSVFEVEGAVGGVWKRSHAAEDAMNQRSPPPLLHRPPLPSSLHDQSPISCYPVWGTATHATVACGWAFLLSVASASTKYTPLIQFQSWYYIEEGLFLLYVGCGAESC